MAGDAPLLERLAKLPAIPAAAALELLERLAQPQTDPVIGPLFGVDEEGDAAVNPLVPAVLKQFGDRQELTCYAALIEGLTGVWNAAVRAAVVTRLRASGLPAEKPGWAGEWLADPFTQDALLVQQCVIRMLFALRAMADARAGELTTTTG